MTFCACSGLSWAARDLGVGWVLAVHALGVQVLFIEFTWARPITPRGAFPAGPRSRLAADNQVLAATRYCSSWAFLPIACLLVWIISPSSNHSPIHSSQAAHPCTPFGLPSALGLKDVLHGPCIVLYLLHCVVECHGHRIRIIAGRLVYPFQRGSFQKSGLASPFSSRHKARGHVCSLQWVLVPPLNLFALGAEVFD